MLYSGTDHHLVGEGTMGIPRDERKGLPGYEGYLNNQALSIAELLKDGGYYTYIAGKWHLGSSINAPENKSPDQWGFERSFTLLGGAAQNHFGHDLADAKTYTENGHFVLLPAADAKDQPWYDDWMKMTLRDKVSSYLGSLGLCCIIHGSLAAELGNAARCADYAGLPAHWGDDSRAGMVYLTRVLDLSHQLDNPYPASDALAATWRGQSDLIQLLKSSR
jgi:hypothetical protein